MNIKERNIEIYKYAYEYLLKILPEGLSEKDLEKYFVGDNKDFTSLEEIFERLIISAQNFQRMPNTIKYEERKEQIKNILHNFDYKKIAKMEVDTLYQEFRNTFNVTTNDSKLNSWYKWSKSIIDSAKFICEFENVEDFRKFVEQYNTNIEMSMSLPLLISSKIYNIGFALACDFLKELGYLNYAKPDVHIMDIFNELDLADNDQISVFKATIQMAKDNNVTPYKLDKVLWLICSGNFYKDNVNIGSKKEDFINYIRSKEN